MELTLVGVGLGGGIEGTNWRVGKVILDTSYGGWYHGGRGRGTSTHENLTN